MQPVPRPAPIPWRVGDILLVYATTAVGIILVLASWWAASGEARIDDQVRWAVAGTAGVIVLGAGNLAWLLAGRKATGALRRQVHAAILSTVPDAEASETAVPTTALVAGRTMTRFHRPGCQLVRGKVVRPHSLATHERRGRRPCDVCAPLEDADG